ncbi:conserved hypothetical protein [Ricinus communis]|uniref:Uncharacterized protein n=1 Tax=Ricinus communis TaxID=3988 RepID=B9T862_RICCO|nr:conserved hypothetical protein [Ricinus communis]
MTEVPTNLPSSASCTRTSFPFASSFRESASFAVTHESYTKEEAPESAQGRKLSLYTPAGRKAAGATPRGKKKDSYKKQELTIFPILGVVSQEIAFPKEERAPIYSRGPRTDTCTECSYGKVDSWGLL